MYKKLEVLSDSDRAIIEILHRNCRLPASRIGEELGMPPARVAARIQAIYDLGLIRFTAQRNLRAYGYEAFAIIDLTLTGRQTQATMDAICALPSAIIVAEALGAPHIYVFAVAKTQRDMANLVMRDLAKIENIKSCQTHAIIDVVKYATGVGGIEPLSGFWTPDSEETMDEIIIEKLQVDARIGNSEISRQLGVSEASVRQRINRMVKEDKIRFGLLADQRSLTVNNIRVDIAASPSRVRAISEKVAKVAPWVMVIDGEYQVSIAIQNPDLEWLSRYIRDELEPMNGVLSTRTQTLLRTIKHNYNCIVLPEHG